MANWDNLLPHRVVGPNRYVRLRLVSAMIYAADELHLGDDRAPKREEEWKEITSAESLRHWRRHQAISGPAPLHAVIFDVRIHTELMEKDIRKVLKKALRAVADLRRELATAQVRGEIPSIEIHWLRDQLWKLLITRVCRDGESRSRDTICSDVLAEFSRNKKHFDTLADLCIERPINDAQVRDQIARSVDDFLTREFLVPDVDPSRFKLASASLAAKSLLELTRNADEVDRLFGRAIDAQHEQGFYESATGKQFIQGTIFPEINASYAVDVAKMPADASLRVAIESSPTACRILRQISTPPGNLVKHDLLQIAVTAGVCFDLMNNPELLLEKPLRTAIKEVFAETTKRLPKFIKFIQELAIIKGLSFDQVSEIVLPSPSMQREFKDNNDDEVSLSISQQFPSARRDWALPYLILAGRRAQEPISILNNEDASIGLLHELEDLVLD